MMMRSRSILCVLALGMALTACRGSKSDEPPIHLNPNMDTQDKYKPYRASTFFSDKRAMRTPPKGTIPRGKLGADTPKYKLKSRERNVTSAEAFFTGKENGVYTSGVPFKLDISDLKRGKDRYAVYCTPCHGVAGYGNGTVADRSRGKLMPSNFHASPTECRPPSAVKASIERLEASAKAAMAAAPQTAEPTPPSEGATDDAPPAADPADAWKSEAYLGSEGYKELLALEVLAADPSGGCGEGSSCVANGIELPSDATQSEGQCQRTLGYIYHVITKGVRSMMGYEHQLTDPTDRWAVSAYVRALQLSQSSDRNQVVDVLSSRQLSPASQTQVFEQLDKGGEYTFTNTYNLAPVKGAKK